MTAFDPPTEVMTDGAPLRGLWRRPHQMLAAQTIDAAGSIHDDHVAQRFGFRAGTIEGPTHFSQFAPLCAQVWGQPWFEAGCLSVEYRNPCYAGEEVQALMRWPDEHPSEARIWMKKRDGTEVLRGLAYVGHAPSSSAGVRGRLLRATRSSAPTSRGGVVVGTKSGRRRVTLLFDRQMGRLYPFSLKEKLKVITEPSPWYTRRDGSASPWGRPIIPLEMISVLLRFEEDDHPFPLRSPGVDLFAAQEIRLLNGPLFTESDYDIQHEVVALGESRRTESVWIETQIFSPNSEQPVATMLLDLARFKEPSAATTEQEPPVCEPYAN